MVLSRQVVFGQFVRPKLRFRDDDTLPNELKPLLSKRKNGTGWVGGGSFGHVYRLDDDFVLKEMNSERSAYGATVLDTLTMARRSKLDTLNDFIVWSCDFLDASNGPEVIMMESVTTLANADYKKMQGERHFYDRLKAWLSECREALEEHGLYFPDLSLNNLGYVQEGTDYKFRLIDTDGMISGQFDEPERKRFASVFFQSDKKTPCEPFNADCWTAWLKSVHTYGCALLLMSVQSLCGLEEPLVANLVPVYHAFLLSTVRNLRPVEEEWNFDLKSQFRQGAMESTTSNLRDRFFRRGWGAIPDFKYQVYPGCNFRFDVSWTFDFLFGIFKLLDLHEVAPFAKDVLMSKYTDWGKSKLSYIYELFRKVKKESLEEIVDDVISRTGDKHMGVLFEVAPGKVARIYANQYITPTSEPIFKWDQNGFHENMKFIERFVELGKANACQSIMDTVLSDGGDVLLESRENMLKLFRLAPDQVVSHFGADAHNRSYEWSETLGNNSDFVLCLLKWCHAENLKIAECSLDIDNILRYVDASLLQSRDFMLGGLMATKGLSTNAEILSRVFHFLVDRVPATEGLDTALKIEADLTNFIARVKDTPKLLLRLLDESSSPSRIIKLLKNDQDPLKNDHDLLQVILKHDAEYAPYIMCELSITSDRELLTWMLDKDYISLDEFTSKIDLTLLKNDRDLLQMILQHDVDYAQHLMHEPSFTNDRAVLEWMLDNDYISLDEFTSINYPKRRKGDVTQSL
jgi:hypothetical protein